MGSAAISGMLRDLDAPAVRQVVRNPRGAESVAAYRSLDAGIAGTASHHLPDIGARQRPRPEFLCLADRGAEKRPFAIVREARRFDVGAKIFFQLVMAGHLIDLAVFF